MKLRACLITLLAALVLFSVGCVEDRTELPPDKVLLGHWIRKSGDRHYYISEKGITETNAEGKVLEQGFYRVVKQTNIFYRELTIEARFESHTAERTFRFSKDGEKTVEILNLNPLMFPVEKIPPTIDWVYVDTTQQP